MTTATLERPTTAAHSAEPDHAHHWLIEEANGPSSVGICKRCGQIRAFKNWIEDADFLTGEERRPAA
jgi:hypothetical protein